MKHEVLVPSELDVALGLAVIFDPDRDRNGFWRC
jgi:hypothetical protein